MWVRREMKRRENVEDKRQRQVRRVWVLISELGAWRTVQKALGG